MTVKPPIGITPKRFWKEQRLDDLSKAVERYTEAGLESEPCVKDWIEEMCELYTDLFGSQ